ncbi:uncharacterized protein LOC112511462 [Cynara cardunculus var. scolymus]|uniref:uncharacterized protein LOC112511462 n=1 Tax=Cynara cardunculus var. scolymus TaxID=59895 RepID=UPI000D62DAC3|nr:uncharacterized protein LOC112511462 [Cynara cardunculus var. scolymus]
MDVAAAMDFDFNSSSYGGASYYNSAPSSPTRMTEFYCQFDELLISAEANHTNCLAAVPFAWEEKPGVPKGFTDSFEDDFSFDVSCQFGRDLVAPAEDLFDGGVIKTVDSTPGQKEKRVERERGRERGFSSSSRLPSSRSRRTRSLSPLGGSDYRREQQQQHQQQLPAVTNTKPPAATTSSSSENASRKWSFKDLFLFRSASDGRAMDRDPLKKYSTISRKHDQDFRNSAEAGSVSKRRGRVSAHEQHYNLNRAVSNDMKKKTYLPYRHGILGGLAFNP